MGRAIGSLLVGVLMLAACSGGGAETVPPSTSVIITTTTQASPPSSLPRTGCCEGIELEPGRYELPPYWVRGYTVAVGSDWLVNFDNSAALLSFVQGENSVGIPSRWFYLIRVPEGLDAEAVIEAMAGMESITLVGEPSPAEFGGYSGFRFDASAVENPDQPAVPANGIEAGATTLDALNDTGYFTTGFLMITATRESMLRFISLDLEERTMLALIDSPPEEFEDFAATAEAILASLSPVG
jgi:hypothetical protein